jgi:hypothetical protein
MPKNAAGGQETPSARSRSAASVRFSIKSGDFAAFGPVAFAVRFWHSSAVAGERSPPSGRGCSSVVEHDLAKVGVEGSSPFARSKFPVRPTDLCCRHVVTPCLPLLRDRRRPSRKSSTAKGGSRPDHDFPIDHSSTTDPARQSVLPVMTL